ncbi:hypothetical protein [Alicyclobacillus suci]|uniref:hypothetical protein n=1 Tax=Alicyclobacillus suci TaxID=2816080 RepID=UPI001A8FBA7B|nr:hypothetical protein [Alicyclobacillus suci]
MNITSTPNGWKVNVSSAPVTGTPPNGQMQFSIGGNQDEFLRAPKLVAKDPASGVDTTYVPVYYANLFLENRLLMGANWNGNTWSLIPQILSTSELASMSSTQLGQYNIEFKKVLPFAGENVVRHVPSSQILVSNPKSASMFGENFISINGTHYPSNEFDVVDSWTGTIQGNAFMIEVDKQVNGSKYIVGVMHGKQISL